MCLVNIITEKNEILEDEKFFPISVNPGLCTSCIKCTVICHPKATFFKGKVRYVDYNKCKGCLRCVSACKSGAIEVISLKEGNLIGFKIIKEKCELCGKCIELDFCFQNLFEIVTDKENNKTIQFKEGNFSKCERCLKCFKECPNNAIIPIIK